MDARREIIHLVGGGDLRVGDLQEMIPCFGRSFAKTNTTCCGCHTPIIAQGKLISAGEACMHLTTTGALQPSKLQHMSVREIVAARDAGETWFQIWTTVLGGAPPELYGRDARKILKAADTALKAERQGLPDDAALPTLKELLNVYSQQRG